MFRATRDWLRRNRTGIAVGAAVIGGTYMVGQYVLGKINDARESAALDRMAKDNIRRRFEQNQIDCTITVLALLPTLTENILEVLPAEQITQELQNKKAERLARLSGEGVTPSEISSIKGTDAETTSLSSLQTGSYLHTSRLEDSASTTPRRTKAQLWNDLKITSITRALTLCYSLSLLMLLTRIQLNLLGRLNYLSSVVQLAQPQPAGRANSISLEDHSSPTNGLGFGNSFDTNKRFLTFSYYLLHKGSLELLEKVRTAVEQVFANISPSEAITSQRISELVLQVRRKVEGENETERYATRWLPYILPSQEDEDNILAESGAFTPDQNSSSPQSTPGTEQAPSRHQSQIQSTSSPINPLRTLLDEAADLIDSPSFTRVHNLILNTLFSHLIDTRIIANLYPRPSTFSPPPSDLGLDAASTTTSSVHPRIIELNPTPTPQNSSEPRVKLASVLALLTRQAHSIGSSSQNPGAPNEYVQLVESEVKELDSFAAVIYTSNLDGTLEETRKKAEEDATRNKRVGLEGLDEVVEDKLEGAWERVVHFGQS